MRNRVAAMGVAVVSTTVIAGGAFLMLSAATPPPSTPAAAGVGAAVSERESAYPTQEDHCYVEGMIPHHEQALELSALVLDASGVRDRTRALAEFIVTDQSVEIDQMRAWQTAWNKASDGASAAGHAGHGAAADGTVVQGCGLHGDHTVMKGMATAEQLTALDAADGAEADRLFLELMIVHHQGALEMAMRAVTQGSNAYVRSSGKHVLVEQEKEIAAMTALLEAG